MKVLVLSDSHGKATLFKQIVERVRAHHVIHCGDFCTKKQMLPNVPLTIVKGNCDFEQVADEQKITLHGFHFFVVHGHNHQVKTNLLPLSYRAEELDIDIICFGHSHYPVCEQEGRRLYLNPGSIASPRGFTVPTYAVVELLYDRKVNVHYFQTDGRKIMERGGLYQL